MITKMTAIDLSQSIGHSGADTLYTLWSQRSSLAKLWPLGVAALVFGVAYAPNFRALLSIWRLDPSYSHGLLVIPIALAILWQRLSGPQPESRLSVATPSAWWGWGFLITVLAVRAIAYERNFQWIETATILPVIICLTWTFGGWPLLRRIWPAIAFLVFMFPLPQLIDNLLALPLQGLAATGSCFLLQMSGMWAVQEGNVIHLLTHQNKMVPLDVAIACNGLRMLMTLTATIAATIILVSLPTWKRICLLLSVVPIALFSNMIRIVATGWCYYLITGPQYKDWAHSISGWLMVPLALILVGLELGVLSWLVPEPSADDDKPISPLFYIHNKDSGKDKLGNKDFGEI
jgi:exosortase